MRRVFVVVGIAALAIIVPSVAASAHPLGNFSVNRYAGLRIAPDHVSIHYVLDMAEIPAFQEQEHMDGNGDGRIGRAESDSYEMATCARIARGIHVREGTHSFIAKATTGTLAFRPGAAGLHTLRLECELVATTGGAGSISYADTNGEGRVGWREITAVGDHATLTSTSVPATSISNELQNYPEDLLTSPLNVREARVRFRPGGPAFDGSTSGTVPSLLPRGVDHITRAFTSFLGRRQLTLPFGTIAVLLAVVLGAAHALAPGHGKTVMAAYLVGQKGSARQGALIGLTVTATHTLGVVVLGVLVSASTTIAPERLYPLLGIASGAMLGIVGAGFLRRALRQHDSDHEHAARVGVGRGGLIGMGFAGGLVPSPSALVVLLGAIALKRTWFGVGLVVAYGAGMALTLCGAGLILVKMRAKLERRAGRSRGSRLSRLAHALPVITAIVIMGAGAVLAVRGASQI